jgi:tetratricopeptide (TPR) repeat protein
VVAMERDARAVAAAVQAAELDEASFVYCALGNAHDFLGDLYNAVEYHKQHLAIAQEVGDRAGEARAYGNLGNVHNLLGNFLLASVSFTLSHTLSLDSFCRPTAGKSSSPAGLFPLMYAYVVDCAPASPYAYSSSTHRLVV